MLSLFISYSRADLEWCTRLERHLKGLGRELLREIWYDQHIRPGDEWVPEISDHLDRANIVVLLVSSYFVDSENCAKEVERAMGRHKRGECRVIPVMLRHCNVSGAEFAELQSYPAHDQPIDSDSWTDKELAFKNVADAIGKAARELAGKTPPRMLLNPHREDLTRLLHHLCNRDAQIGALGDAIRPNQGSIRRPFLIVIQGTPSDSLEWFLSRLENILPRFFGRELKTSSPLRWPDATFTGNALDRFRFSLANDCIPASSPFASFRELNAALPADSITLLPSSMPQYAWQGSCTDLLESFLKLWEDWPRLPARCSLIPVLEIQYPEEAAAAAGIVEYLRSLDLSRRASLPGVILPPMEAVDHLHFTNWLMHEKVSGLLRSRERALARSNESDFRDKFPSRMHSVAEVHLPRLLERI
jgi:TIR domain